MCGSLSVPLKFCMHVFAAAARNSEILTYRFTNSAPACVHRPGSVARTLCLGGAHCCRVALVFAAFCVMAYSNSSKEEKEDRLKLAFSLASLESGDPFAVNTHLDVDMMDAIRWFRLNNLHWSCVVVSFLRWQVGRSSHAIIAEREALISDIERMAQEFRRNGDCDSWLQHACPLVKGMAAGVNGPLLEHLALAIGHDDFKCVNLFRYGTPWLASVVALVPVCLSWQALAFTAACWHHLGGSAEQATQSC
jgi:hypothetical protein